MTRQVQNWMALGALTLAAMAPASAQQAMSPTPQRQQAAQGANGTGTQPSSVIVTYPNAPIQQPHLLQNILQMRATSPRPNEFLGGAYNPVYQPVPRPQWPTGPTYYYGGHVDWYPGPVYYPYGTIGGYAYAPYVLQPGPNFAAPWTAQQVYPWSRVYLPPNQITTPPTIIQVRPGTILYGGTHR